MDRRDFLKGSLFFGAMVAASGRAADVLPAWASGKMALYHDKPFAKLRVGVIGLGRGHVAFANLPVIPNCEVTAICDLNAKRISDAQRTIRQAGQKREPKVYTGGPEEWKKLCDDPEVDLVWNATPWQLHVPISLYAMNAGKHVAVEVPAAFTVEECWQLVETSERLERHCMMLENCCYGETEMLALNMCRLGILGETLYGEAAYLHSGATRGFELSKFRAEWYQEHRGNYYPTHGLGPVAQYMNINRGDRFDYLNSMEGKSLGDMIREGAVRWNGNNLETYRKYVIGAYNSSLIRTVNGKTIFLNLSCSAPHPYSRMNTIQGAHGILMDYPLRIDIEDTPGSGPHGFDEKRTAELREKYKHPMWKMVGDIAKKVGGHGGMDFIMDLRWVYCLQNGLPLDMDVYDLASWSCLCEITEKSQAKRGAPVEIPDFTRGAWKTMKPLGIETVDLAKMKFRDVGDAGPQQTIGQSKEG